MAVCSLVLAASTREHRKGERLLSELNKIRRLPHVCRSYQPWLTDHDDQGGAIDPESCMVCEFGKEAHGLSATLEAYEELVLSFGDLRFGDRKKLLDERSSINKKFELKWPPDKNGYVETFELYLIVGLYEDGTPGELFFACSKVGDHLHGLLAALAMASSKALQHGCPIEKVIAKWKGTQFDPRGFTGDPEFPRCGSILDYVAQYLGARFVGS